MKFLRDMRLALKLPLLITLPTVLFVTLAGLSQLWQFSKTLNQQTQNVYVSVAEQRAKQLKHWLNGLEQDIDTLARSAAVIDSIQGFSAGWAALGSSPSEYLRGIYIDGNAFPSGRKDELFDGGDQSDWSNVHARHHLGLRSFQHVSGYQDLYLFDTDGNLIYSVSKEDDFGLNFETGQYAGSGLGEVYQQTAALPKGAVYITNITKYAPSGGTPAMFLAQPVFNDGARIGVVAVRVPLDKLNEVSATSDMLGKTGRVILIDAEGQLLSMSQVPAGDSNLTSVSTAQTAAALAGDQKYFQVTPGATGAPSVAATNSVVTLRGDLWGVVVEADTKEALGAIHQLQVSAVLGLVITALMLTGLSWLVGRSIANRFVRLSGDLDEISKENFDLDVSGTNNRDEIGQMAKKLEELKSRLQEGKEATERADEVRAREAEMQEREHEAQKASVFAYERIGKALDDIAKGEFRTKITETFPSNHESLRQNVNNTMDSLSKVVAEVGDAASRIEKGGTEISNATSELASRTESQAATLEQTVAALDEITASVKSASQNVRTAEDAATGAKSDAERSGQVVGETIEAMTEIETSSRQITQIISVIEDIAFQTNLLALNAGVEAARAGEAGKGFAVVATEVRALAQRASDAALEIKTLIEKSGEQVERGVVLVDRTGEALKTIVERVANISDLVTDIARSANEQATALDEINTGVSQLDRVTQNNAAMVEETTAASQLLRTDSQRLTGLMSSFRTDHLAPAEQPATTKAKAPTQPAKAKPKKSEPVRRNPQPTPRTEVPLHQESEAEFRKRAANAGWEDF